MQLRPAPAFVFGHPAHFIAFGFGAGLSPIAPGTVGTLLAFPLMALLDRFLDGFAALTALAVAFSVGVWASHRTGVDLGIPDHGGIVWDEVVAFALVLFVVGPDPWRQAFGFLLFRLFDIVKPQPARFIDRHWHHGFGVMADDLVAAFYALLALSVGTRVFA